MTRKYHLAILLWQHQQAVYDLRKNSTGFSLIDQLESWDW